VAKFDRPALLKAYEKLYEEACAVEVDDVTTYIIDPKTITDAALIEMGKELRSKVNTAKAFM
jgi:CRISPR/Cas system-associated protein Cas10 (large subunit of type III CRISPR-Cas system)